MAREKITKNLIPKNNQPGGVATIYFNFPDTLREAVEKYGEETVYGLFLSRAVVLIQSEMSKVMLSKNENGDYIYMNKERTKLSVPQKELDNYFEVWKLSYRRGRSDNPMSKIKKVVAGLEKLSSDDLSNMSPEERKALANIINSKLGI